MANVQYYNVGCLIALILCSDVSAKNYENCSVKKINECDDGSHKNTELLLVNVLFKHGDRTVEPISGEYFPNDPHKDDDYYPDNDGLLTKIGKRRAYELGKLLRKRYNDLLGDFYFPPHVYARSTEVPRTKMTLQLVLAGLYPPVNFKQKWLTELPWQPFDITYSPYSQDGLFLPFLCIPYREAYLHFIKKESVRNELRSYRETLKLASKLTGKEIDTVKELSDLYNMFSIYLSTEKSIPNWANNVYTSNQLFYATLLTYTLPSRHKELHKFYGGKLLYRILQDMQKVINKTLDRKINLFSANGGNVAEVLLALDIFDNKIPEYTSAVILELHHLDKKYFVQVIRYLGIPPVFVKTTLPGCSELCPIEKFVTLISSVMGSDDPSCPMGIND